MLTALKIFFFCFFFLFANLNYVFAKDIFVGKGEKHLTAASALKAAEDGDRIFIKGGYYSECPIIIDKSVSIIGIDNPVFDALSKDEGFIIRADNVTIKGITIQNSGISYIEDKAAVKLESVSNCVIEENILLNNFFGIYLSKVSNSAVKKNRIKASNLKETASGNGIHLWNSNNIIIENNSIEGHRDGIYFEFVKKGEIKSNISYKNLRYGLHFMFSDSCYYAGNTFKENGAGVAVMYTKKVTMTDNLFVDNWGSASYGLLLKEISDSEVYGNKFTRNTIGLYSEGSNRVKIYRNDFNQNGWAVRLMANSVDNVFSKNNFIGNSFDVATNSQQHYNKFINNYWDNYKGYDLNKDGKGDIPFRPVRLYSMIVANTPTALIFLRSLFVDVLDVAERALPSITPKTLTDEAPLMRKRL
jgi:nitrous oxidase accessory protein